jgi:hypothetical protein
MHRISSVSCSVIASIGSSPAINSEEATARTRFPNASAELAGRRVPSDFAKPRTWLIS